MDYFLIIPSFAPRYKVTCANLGRSVLIQTWRMRCLWKTTQEDIRFRIQALTGCGKPANDPMKRWSVWDVNLPERVRGGSYFVWKVLDH